MPDESIKRQLRRCREATANILDEESFHVNETSGKAAVVYDFMCFDRGCWKLVKVCVESITRHELRRFLEFSGTPCDNGMVLQIFFWRKRGRHPFYRPKLAYNRPDQEIPPELQKLVK